MSPSQFSIVHELDLLQSGFQGQLNSVKISQLLLTIHRCTLSDASPVSFFWLDGIFLTCFSIVLRFFLNFGRRSGVYLERKESDQ